MANDILDTIFKGVLAGENTRYLYLYEQVTDEFFEDEYKVLWKLICRVHDVSRQIIDTPTFDKFLPRIGLPVEKVAKVEDLWRRLEDAPNPSEADFRSSISLLQEDHKTSLLGQALTDSLEVLRIGVKDERTGQVKHGPEDALAVFREKMADVEGIGAEALPEFDIRDQKEDILAELVSDDVMDRLTTGITPLDEMTLGGHAPGELWLGVAGTGVGKSMMGVNIAHHRVINGSNVIYFTTETLFKQIRHRVIMRHTHLEQFGIPNGLSSMKVKLHSADNPELKDFEFQAYVDAVTDFSDNPNYGRLIVCQVPDRTRLSAIEAKLYRWHERYPIDYCILDSPDMFAPETKRPDERQELNEIVNGTKSLCVGFDGGRGLRVFAPWQASRSGQEKAKLTGRYGKDALSDTAMAEKRADLIIAMLENVDTPTKLKAQVLKFRDSTPEDFDLDVFYDRCYIGSDVSLQGESHEHNITSLL